MANFIKIVFLLLHIMLCVQVNAQESRLITLSNACIKATGGYVVKGINPNNLIDIVMPPDMNSYKFVSSMASVMKEVIPQYYIGVLPWTIDSNTGTMTSIHYIKNDYNNLLVMFYFRATNTLRLYEDASVDLMKMLQSSNYPTLSNPHVYSTIYAAVTQTNGFITEADITEFGISTKIQIQMDASIQTVIDQLKGCHAVLLMLPPRYEQVDPWHSITKNNGLVNSGVWATRYILTYSYWEKSSIKMLDIIYQEKPKKIIIDMYEKLPDK